MGRRTSHEEHGEDSAECRGHGNVPIPDPRFPTRPSRLSVAACLAILLCAGTTHAAEEEPAELEDVTVTATRTEQSGRGSPESVGRVSGRSVERTGATHPNEILARIPGVWISRGSGQEHLTAIRSPVLTGAGACGAFLYAVDGIPVRPTGFCNVNQLFEVNTGQAGAIEVMKGPGSALYGSNALHGIINVITPEPSGRDALGWRAEAGADGYRRLRTDADLAAGDGALRILAEATLDDGFRADSDFRSLKTDAVWRTGAGDRLHLAVTDLDQDTAGFVLGRDAYRDRRLRLTNPNPEAYRDAEAARLSGAFRRALDDGELVLRPVLRRSRMDFLMHFLPGTPLETNAQTSAALYTAWERQGGDDIWGLDLEYARGTLSEDQAGFATGSAFLRDTRPPGLHYDYSVDSRLLALYRQRSWRTGTTRLSVGARAEYLAYDYTTHLPPGNLREDGTPCPSGGCLFFRPADREDRYLDIAWNLGAVHELDGLWRWKARAAQGFRAPQATELYRLQSGQAVADLAPERIVSLESGLVRSGERLDLALTAYWMDKENVIFRDAAGFNVSDGATVHRGLEFELDWRLSDEVTLSLDGSLAAHRYAFDRAAALGETIVSGNTVDSAPSQLLDARLAWTPHPDWFLELEGVRVGSYYLDAANTASYPGHTLFHLRGRHRFGERWTLDLRLMNLTDRLYAERADFAFGNFRYFPGRDRRIMMVLSHSL